ncbi:hypothetical protein GGS23DRAFT_598278 [Durotheca rogersii]|uniref:uncharacterized protein n=1 Tax=Durotheca rogersii TaxID=419775 RepID=UPI0022200D34|nr:uncharacterized protein GGS23DRAFT_598278 [Durotheca rogersii]KAI5861497.1 hypothetical protein GGS23DRAFT_598278 [Durotheca rogersii]
MRSLVCHTFHILFLLFIFSVASNALWEAKSGDGGDSGNCEALAAQALLQKENHAAGLKAATSRGGHSQTLNDFKFFLMFGSFYNIISRQTASRPSSNEKNGR